jgi:hypothetical protein
MTKFSSHQDTFVYIRGRTYNVTSESEMRRKVSTQAE